MDHIAKPWRETPLVESAALSKVAGCRIFLKLECLQPSGSFKSRGIGNYMLARLRETHSIKHRDTCDDTKLTHFYSSSGGNAGLAAVYASQILRYPCTVIVPTSTSPLAIKKIWDAGAHDVVQHGASWKDADAYLREEVLPSHPGSVYVPPFDHEDIWEGNATIVEELMRQFAELSPSGSGSKGLAVNGSENNNKGEHHTSDILKPAAIVCSVGGGGLFNGITQGLRGSTSSSLPSDWSSVPVVAVETRGADSLGSSVAANEHITLDAITSAATTLGASRVSARTWETAREGVKNGSIKSVVLSDADAAKGCVALAETERLLVELACGVNIGMCFEGRLEKTLCRKMRPDECVVLVVCGGSNVTAEMVSGWKKEQSPNGV